MRAASDGLHGGGTWTAGPGAAPAGSCRARRRARPISTSVRTLSSRKNGLPSVRSIRSVLSGVQARIGPEQRVEQLAGALGGQGIQPSWRVVRLAAPAVPVLGPVVHQEQEARGRERSTRPSRIAWVSASIQWRSSNDHQQRLTCALAKQQALDGVQGTLRRWAGRASCHAGSSVGTSSRASSAGRSSSSAAASQLRELPRHLLANLPRVVSLSNPAVAVGGDRSPAGRASPCRSERERPRVRASRASDASE